MPYASSSSTDVYEVFECISEVFELKLVMSVAERAPVAMLMLVRDNIDWGFERSESVREGTGDGEDGNPARDPLPTHTHIYQTFNMPLFKRHHDVSNLARATTLY